MKDRKKGLIGFNKFTIILVLIYFLGGVGISYAYFAFNYENTSIIVGNVVNVDADLTVRRVVGTDEKMVPMIDEALSNALNAVGTTNGACIDSLGNLSCQVYEITLTNNASRLQHLVGTIKLYPKSGTGNAYSNLKWRELTNTTTVKSDSILNNMNESILVSGLTLESKESKTWYVGVWLSEIDSDQKNIDKGEFQGTVTFEVNEDIVAGTYGEMPTMNSFATEYMIPGYTNDSSLTFTSSSASDGTNGVYLKNETANDKFPIYYYRGNVDNNIVFANFCWKVVRTTETGGLKLIYNGTPTVSGDNVSCNNIGAATTIGNNYFNEQYNSPAYVGYKYGNPYTVEFKDMTDDTTAYVYGNSVSYDNGTYTLTGGTTSGAWSSVYNGGLDNYHYTCFTTGTTCSNDEVYYIYVGATNDTDYYNGAYYLKLTGGVNISEALDIMLGSDESNDDRYNATSSTIKGSSDIEGVTLDYWYQTNLDGTEYETYLEDTVWCSDRSIYQLGGLDPNGGAINVEQDEGIGEMLIFGAMGRYFLGGTPTLTCAREIDKFTKDSKNGNGDLDYPVGLLTLDETWLAGGHLEENREYYLYNGTADEYGVGYWSGSPMTLGDDFAVVSLVYSDGGIVSDNVNINIGVRPSISLKPGFSIVGDGDGTAENPYIVE